VKKKKKQKSKKETIPLKKEGNIFKLDLNQKGNK